MGSLHDDEPAIMRTASQDGVPLMIPNDNNTENSNDNNNDDDDDDDDFVGDLCDDERTGRSLPSDAPPKKYTQEYFEDRIETLRRTFREALPRTDDLDLFPVFSSVVRSLEAAKGSLDSATHLLRDLQEAEANGTAIDPKVIEQAQDAVEQARETSNRVRAAATEAGCALVTANRLNVLTDLVDQAELLECTVLVQATPRGLAEWCQAGDALHPKNDDVRRVSDDDGNEEDEEDEDVLPSHGQTMNPNEALLDAFLKDVELMKQVLIANGPSTGLYGPMLSIHSRIREEMAATATATTTDASAAAKDGNRQDDNSDLQERLALAVALEHAKPISVFRTGGKDEPPAVVVDPVARFWHYAHAHQSGELDEAFAAMSTWDLRLVVDCNATNEDLQWGRDYLRAYRPDQIWTHDAFQYIWSVRTDLGYRQPDHDFANYVDLISAGGECGARAWFGRFICKAFGIPTWGVRQPGHAAVGRWLRTPPGGARGCGEGSSVKWETCLGAGWDLSEWDENRYTGADRNGERSGLDFFEETQARNAAAASCGCKSYYHMVTLVECLAESFGETVEEDYSSQKIWRSLSIAQRKMLAQDQPSTDLVSNEGKDDETTAFGKGEFVERRVEKDTSTNDGQGNIHPDVTRVVIPAGSFVDPPKPTKTVMPMKSFYGGTQLHLEKDGAVEYEMPPTLAEGEYSFSCTVVNIHRFQMPLLVTIESESCGTCMLDDDEFEMILSPQVLTVQYTMGYWQRTKSINVRLKPGDRLKLRREPNPPALWGLTIKELVLEPIYCI